MVSFRYQKLLLTHGSHTRWLLIPRCARVKEKGIFSSNLTAGDINKCLQQIKLPVILRRAHPIRTNRLVKVP